MAHLGQEFDVNTLPQSESNFDPLPAGWYDVNITGAELKDTNDRTGNYINVKYSVTGPTHQGRVVFGMLNLKNKNPKAEEIGRQQLGELMRACGLARVTDSDQLIGGRCAIKIAIKPPVMVDDPQRPSQQIEKYPAGNEVKGFKAIAGSAAPTFTPAPAAQATASAAPPWARK